MINPFTARLDPNANWVWPVSAVSLVVGVMISYALITREARIPRDPEVERRYVEGKIDMKTFDELSTEVTRLRAENTRLQDTMAQGSKQGKVLNDSLQQVKLFAGLTDVTGPGVTITLIDSQNQDIPDMERIIHDYDTLRIVNELWASGAQAIEVNGNRIVGSSTFRCVGPTILVDNKPIASPVKVRAIGDVDTMLGGVNLPGGVLDELRQNDPQMVRVDKVKQHRFASFSGSTTRNLLQVPKDNK